MAKLIDLFRFLMAYARALRRTRHVHRQYYKYIIIEATNGYEHNLEKNNCYPILLLPNIHDINLKLNYKLAATL